MRSVLRARLPLAGLTTGAMLLGAPIGVATLLHVVPARAQGPAQPLQRDVGKPLEKAKELAAQKDFSGAMAQIDDAEHARHKTAEENFVIEEMRASVAQQSGDYKTAIAADDELLNTGKLGRADQQRLLMAEASSNYQLHDYAGTIKAIDRYQQAGGTDPSLTQLKIQCYYLLKDYPHAAAEQSAQIEAEIKANKVPPEQQLQLLASCQIQTKDAAGLTRTMTHLVEYYPKPDYWAQLLHGLRADPNVPDRLEFDVDRLRLAVGLLTSTADFMDMTERAVQDGLPAHALAIMNRGYATGALGTGSEAPREARLKALVEHTIASRKASLAADITAARKSNDPNALLSVGYTATDLGENAQGIAQGIAMMREAITRGGLVAPYDAMLHLGLAYLDANDKASGIAALRAVGGGGPAEELAHLWLLRIGAH
ncbi:hypothetical protein [Lichenicoccus sp.]|uniref:hypothetical protein n=1 Tax=Lichenicoccus sp. TaxID=2781899 RepID=UPI003D0F078E